MTGTSSRWRRWSWKPKDAPQRIAVDVARAPHVFQLAPFEVLTLDATP